MDRHKLKGIRTSANLTQNELAEHLKVTTKTYNHKENGEIEFKLSEILKIALFLEMTLQQVDDIFFDSKLTERINKLET